MHTTNLRKVGGSVMLAVPPAILEQLQLKVGATVGLAVDGERLVMQPRATGTAEFAAMLRADWDRWARVVQESGFKPED